MKKLLFLHPIAEYMEDGNLFSDESLEQFYRTLDKRYRQQNYEINFLMFQDKKAPYFIGKEGDKIIGADMTFWDFIAEENFSLYPDNELIYQQVKGCDELVVCGFHANDCVKRVAEYCYNQGLNVLVDVELTDMFRYYRQNYAFDENKYNLANIMMYIKAQNYLFGNQVEYQAVLEQLFSEPYYQREKFKPDANFEKILAKLNEEEKTKVKVR